MGTVVAQDIFQSKLDSIFIGMEGVTGLAYDMVIAGRDKMEHDRNFLAFMEKCMSNNLTLNLEKIQFKQSQVSFYGHCWSKHRISPDPTGQGNYEIFPGNDQLPQQVQCTPHCTPQCTHTSGHRLQARNSVFCNFNQLKLEISNMKGLPYFDVNAETTLQTDASKKGLGACLIQKGKVICYPSRVLTKTEQNYQNLE